MELINSRRFTLIAVTASIILVALLLRTCFHYGELRGGNYPDKQSGFVQTQMKNVDFRIDTAIILRIINLRGRLIPTKGFSHPVFNKKESFILEIFSATIKMDMKSLSILLNKYVFGNSGSSVKIIRLSTSGNQIKQEGTMKGIPFSILSDVSLTPEGKIKLHPADIKAVGIKVDGIMKLLHIELEKLISADSAYGLKVVGDDLFLDPERMLPPPHIKGHLKSLKIGNNEITQEFFSKSVPPLKPHDSYANYIYFKGGDLTFGKLTMKDSDMQIIDKDPKDPLDFFNDLYFKQLIAGYHKTTNEDGLLIFMPDYSDLKK